MSIQDDFAQDAAGPFEGALGLLPADLFLPSERAIALGEAGRFWARSPAKRAFDLAIAVPLLAALLPLLALLALLIRIESKGPALFRQKRLGCDGVPFEILKLRSMTVQEDGAHIVQASRGDARITRLGRVLRALSLDELPQLFNVVKGEMSLIGPRPHAIAHDLHYAKLIAGYGRRQEVKPGLTGWAQVNGHRGPTPTLDAMVRRVAFDLAYVHEASFALDAAILLRTPLVLLSRRNAV